jgi:2,4-dienoyl-CoA reductase (NADPH2)
MELFTSKKINKLNLKNRILMSTIHLGFTPDGRVNERIKCFYKERARGGVSSIIVGGVAVERAGSLTNMVSLEDDSYIEGFKELVETIHKYDCNVFAQLFHAGRNAYKSYTKQDLLAPSPIPSPITKETPKELTIKDIERVKNSFAEAAKRAKKAGADGIEISCSAGYLLASFLSPLTNKRTDMYGGNSENRMRFPQEIVKEIRRTVGYDYPVTLRISGGSMIDGCYELEYMKKFCSTFKEGELDAIHVTGGWHEAPVPQISSHLPAGTFSLLASAIKDIVNIPVIASNRINNGEIAEKIISKGLAHFVAMGRGLIADPELPNKIKEGRNIRKCLGCNQGCIDNVFIQLPIRCVVNSSVGNEEIVITQSEKPKRILVVGGGVAGMEAARIAKLANHEVTLCTKEEKLGGQINIASVPPDKEELLGLVDYIEKEIVDNNVDIRYKKEVDETFIDSFKPEHIILATGSAPIIPNIPGIDSENVFTASQVLSVDNEKLREMCRGRVVIIGGGAVGLETANYIGQCKKLSGDVEDFIDKYLPGCKSLNREFKDISVIEMLKRIGNDLGGSVKWIIIKELKRLGVKTYTNSKVIAINKNNIIVEQNNESVSIPADTVILAIGSKPYDSGLLKWLKHKKYPYSLVGDVKKPGKIMNATNDALKVIAKL